jgi:hypothetical protein
MGLFRRSKPAGEAPPAAGDGPHGGALTIARDAPCRICKGMRHFSRCWLRPRMLTACTHCNAPFDDPRALYALRQPACPHCGEFLEHPGFEYGLCDDCGSKYELVENCVPGLLPNAQQREAMNQTGRSRSIR